MQSFSPVPQCYSSGSKFSILPPAVVDDESRLSCKLSACKTTISKEAAGMSERNMQENLRVPSAETHGRLVEPGVAALTERSERQLRPQRGPTGILCWSNPSHCPRWALSAPERLELATLQHDLAAEPWAAGPRCHQPGPAQFGWSAAISSYTLSWSARWPRPICLLSGRNVIRKEVIKSRR